MSVIDDLDRVFPGYRSPERAAAWEAAKARLPVGARVTGGVVARYHFGAFVDIGVGFPALLEIVRMEGLTPERYRADEWCPVGSSVTAFVGGFRDDTPQVGLWQVQPRRGAMAPEPIVRAALRVLHVAGYATRNWTDPTRSVPELMDAPTQRVFDLWEALHPMPETLLHWTDGAEQRLLSYFDGYNAKWPQPQLRHVFEAARREASNSPG